VVQPLPIKGNGNLTSECVEQLSFLKSRRWRLPKTQTDDTDCCAAGYQRQVVRGRVGQVIGEFSGRLAVFEGANCDSPLSARKSIRAGGMWCAAQPVRTLSKQKDDISIKHRFKLGSDALRQLIHIR